MVTENTELRIQELQEETENVKYRIEILYLLRGEVALKVNQEKYYPAKGRYSCI